MSKAANRFAFVSSDTDDARAALETLSARYGQMPVADAEIVIALTVYKAMGHACEDLAAASLVYHRAKRDGAGRTVVL